MALEVILVALLVAAVIAVAAVQVLSSRRPDAVPAPAHTGPVFPCPTVTGPRLPGQFAPYDYPELIVWAGRDYTGTGITGTPGIRIGAVTCDIQTISDTANANVPRPWPDGSSTAAAVGTAIHEQVGSDPGCELTVRMPDRWMVFRAGNC